MISSQAQPEPFLSERRRRDLIGLAFFFAGAAILLWLCVPEQAPVPKVLDTLLRLVAGPGALVIPVILLFVGSMFLVGFERLMFTHSTLGSIIGLLTFVAWRHTAMTPLGAAGADLVWSPDHVSVAGGYLGAAIGWSLTTVIGLKGAYVMLTLAACSALVLLVDRPFIEMLRSIQKPVSKGAGASGRLALKTATAATTKVKAIAAKRRSNADDDQPLVEFSGKSKVDPTSTAERTTVPALPSPRKRSSKSTPASPDELVLPFDPPLNAGTPGSAGVLTSSDEGYILPPVSLLKEPALIGNRRSPQEIQEKIHVLEQTLDQFKIQANVVEIAHGPTVTRYEIQLAPGIKVGRIVSLADNLAMSLAAIDVRVEAPIPGKSAIGIEVPNKNPTAVMLREVLESAEFAAAGKLSFALGKDVSGNVHTADLTKMPHLLVAGSTNSGKSVCLNVIIASLLYRLSPREVQFLMIDPKRVELSLWEGIPHLMHPVVKDVKQAASLLKAAIREMDRRYDLCSKLGTRNIDGYNEKVTYEERLPYLVIVIDELADLMMQAAGEVEHSICRLAQLARAVGIHLVVATQRPSVDVITGLIKANISSRIAFMVSSQVDSRTILDLNGAERLIGRGDMLYMPIDGSKPLRIQGCFLSESETNDLVNWLKEQERPTYSLNVSDPTSRSSSGDRGGMDDEDDEFFEPAVKLVVTNGQASTSMLQRRFKIGYTRAARLVDLMEARGIVGALDGSKPREILASRSDLDRMFLGE